MSDKKPSRREFLNRSTTAATAATAATFGLARASGRVRGANERIRLGFIGVGNRGSQLLHSFMKHDDMEVVAICDVYQPYLARDRSQVDRRLLAALGGRVPAMGEKLGSQVTRYSDFRKLLDRPDIDAVVIATPDHWHAIHAITAMEAGKDIYVEKPLSITIHEGRAMVQAAKRTRRIAQVGLHRRSSILYKKVHDLVQAGKIGKVSLARAYRISNMFPNGIGREPITRPVKGLDWNMWLGPRADRDYQTNIMPYKFRWWKSYSSQMGNWGVHYCDAVRWVLDDIAPIEISAHGGRFAVDDDRTIPDTMEVIFELPSKTLLIFGQYEACGGLALPQKTEIEFRGTLANLYTGVEANGYEIMPSKPGQFQTKASSVHAETCKKLDGDLTDQHTRNFLDCVKSRHQCHCDLETAHRSTTFAHLANIALWTRSRLQWDATRERVVNNESANQYLHYEYRKPWKLG